MIHRFTPKPNGGKRGNSRYAHLYADVCELLKKQTKWEEIAEILSEKEGVKIAKTSLFQMWDARWSGRVRLLNKDADVKGNESPRSNEVVRKPEQSLPDEWKPRRAIEYGEEAGAGELKKAGAKRKEPSPWDQINPNDFIQ